MRRGDPVATPRDESGLADYNLGWKLWSDMARYYPSAVHRRRLILKWLSPLRPQSVLDVGCGTGVLLEAIHGLLPEAQLTGVDYAVDTMAQNAKEMPWSAFQRLDITSEALDRRFDAVVCSEVMEHVVDDEGALDNLVAMTGRYLCITVPTGRMFATEIGFGHLRHYDLESLCGRIESRGLRIARAEAWGFPWMTAFKRLTNVRASATMRTFGGGSWGLPQRAVAGALTALFYLNVAGRGPQLLILASRPD